MWYKKECDFKLKNMQGANKMRNRYKRAWFCVVMAIEFLVSVFLVPSSAVLAAEKVPGQLYGVYESVGATKDVSAGTSLSDADFFAERELDPCGIFEEEPGEETDRYIIKYREVYQTEVENELKATAVEVVEQKNVAHLRAELAPAERAQRSLSVSLSESLSDDVVFKTDVIVLEEVVHPDEIWDKFENLEEYVTYIQPDYLLSLDSLNDGASFSFEFTEETSDTTYSGGGVSSSEETVVTGQTAETTAEPVIVAVLDTGVDINHPALEGHIWTNPSETPGDGEDNDGNSFADDIHGWNFPEDSPVVYSSERPLEYAHGTHAASTIVSAGETNGAGVVIMPIKVFADGTAFTSDVIAGIQYAVAQGAAVINCSFGSGEENPALREAIEAAEDVLFVAAVGNHRRDLAETPTYPACFDLPNVISVASVNADDGFSYYSNYGEAIIDIAARGRDVVGAFPENETGPLSGTSVSAAQVSGAAAAVKAAETDITAAALRQRLIATADRLSNLQNKIWEGRRLNVENALLNVTSDVIVEINPADDFDVHGVQPGTSQLYELYTSAGNVMQIDATDHTLVVKDDGTVWSWGNNQYGQCGVGYKFGNIKFAQVQGLSDVVAVSAGRDNSLAVKSDGTVWVWGQDYNNIPNQIVGLTDVTAVSAGGANYALKSNGTVWAWGNNYAGQLGDGTTITRLKTPAQISGLSNVAEVIGGYSHAIARKSDGTVYAWGSNSYGEVGDGTNTNRSVPTQVTTLSGIIKVSSKSYHNIALKDDGTLWTWGNNTHGTLGDDTTINRNSPVQVQDLSDAMDVSAGYYYTLALKSDGTVWAWGQRGAVVGGLANLTPQETPIQVIEIDNVSTILGGGFHAMAIKMDGTVWAWGNNNYEQLGIGTTACRFAPTPFYGVSDVVSAKGGDTHNLALKADGTVVAWGSNSYGQLGDNSTTARAQPVQVQNLSSVTSIAIGDRHNLAVKSDGTVWLWGNGYAGQTYSQTYSTPVQVSGLTDVVAVSCGLTHNLALKSDGTVWVWGSGRYGALGLGGSTTTSATQLTPVQITGLSDVMAIATGKYHNLALKSDGTVWAWGSNNRGQLGDGTTVDKSTPFQISELTGVSAIACGQENSFAVNGTDGSVKGWGYNRSYQFYSSDTNVLSPMQLNGLDDIVSVAVGDIHLLALKEDGTILARGYNNDGELGDGTNYLRDNPIGTLLISGAAEISAGRYWSYTIMDGTLYAWGKNENSALGLPYLHRTTMPRQVQLTSAVTSLHMSVTPNTLTLPETGTNTALVTAIPRDTNDQILEGQTVIYSLATPKTGVSIDSSTGLVTVASTATEGTVTVRGTCGSVTSTATLTLTTTAIAPASLTVTLTPSSVTIPTSGTVASTAAATVYDADDNILEGQTVTYSLTTPKTGVSIDSSTGVVTVSSTATAGTVTVQGTCGSVTGTATLTLTAVTPASLTVTLTPSSVTVPASGTATATATAVVRDANNNVLTGQTVTYSMTASKTGVTIHTTTGVVTVSSTATAGTVTVQGTCGSVMGTATLTITAAPASLTVTLAPSSVTIPTSGTVTSTASAVVRDANNNILTGQTVTYSLPTSKIGVSVNSSTGVVTVSSTATAGTVTVQGTCGNVTGTATLTLTSSAVNMTLQATANGIYNISVKGNNISSFNGTTYTITYDSSKLELQDFAAQAKRLKTTPGTVAGTGLTIVSHSGGVLTFTVQKTISNGYKWSGVLTILKFRALSTGSSSLQIA
jgi:alpha-tubulin suppressor-like RCC1 family protein